MNTMHGTLLQCPGCNRGFTPSGLSQHVSKTSDARCRHIVNSAQSQIVSAPFPHMASLPPLSPIWAPRIMVDDAPGDGYDSERSGALNEPPDLVTFATLSEFTATHVATAHAAISFSKYRYWSSRLRWQFTWCSWPVFDFQPKLPYDLSAREIVEYTIAK